MDVPYLIRPATSADASALAALERATFSDPWPAEAFVALGAGVSAFVAEAAGVLGFVILRQVADEAELLDIVVRQDRRREGIGTALLDRAQATAVEAGARALFLEVRASNTPAQAFYRRHGFSVIGRRARYYRTPPEDAVVMRCDVMPVTPDA